MMNFPNGFSSPCGPQMGSYGMGMMGAQYPQNIGPIGGSRAPLAAYSSRIKDDTAVKVASLGTLAIIIGAIAMKGKGLKGVLKSSKSVDKGVQAAQQTTTQTATVAANEVAATAKKATATVENAAESVENVVEAAEAVGTAATEAKKPGFFARRKEEKEFNKVVRESKEYSEKYKAAHPTSTVSNVEEVVTQAETAVKPAQNEGFFSKLFSKISSKSQNDKDFDKVVRESQEYSKNHRNDISSALSPIQKVETSAVTNTASAAATATIASKATATVEKAATIAEDTLTLTAQDFAKHKEVSQSAAKVVTNGTTSTSASKATSGSTTAGKSSQASSEVKTTETHKVSKNTEEAYSSNRETKAEAVIKQGNKGNLTNTQRRNAEVNYANEVKKGLHIKPAITEAERIKYSAGVAYTAPVGTQAEALRINNAKANKAKANSSQIGNNISQETYEKLMKIGR